jgi:hypothetical protein
MDLMSYPELVGGASWMDGEFEYYFVSLGTIAVGIGASRHNI